MRPRLPPVVAGVPRRPVRGASIERPMKIIYVACLGLQLSLQPAIAQSTFPWAPEVRCNLNPARPQGLHPGAYAALESLRAAHRITQGINHSTSRGNVHDTDGMINGAAYTGAVDI